MAPFSRCTSMNWWVIDYQIYVWHVQNAYLRLPEAIKVSPIWNVIDKNRIYMLCSGVFSTQRMFENELSHLPPLSGCTSMNSVFVIWLPYECFAYIECMLQSIRNCISIADKLYHLYKLKTQARRRDTFRRVDIWECNMPFRGCPFSWCNSLRRLVFICLTGACLW